MPDQDSAATFLVDQEVLSGNSLDTLEKYLWTRTIQLTDVTSTTPESLSNATIYQGKGKILNVDCSIEVLCSEPGETQSLVICAQPETIDWTFGDCFPQMPGWWTEDPNSASVFFLRYLTLENPLWVFISGAGELLNSLPLWTNYPNKTAFTLKAGLSMLGNLPSIHQLAGIQSLFGGNSLQELLGPIQATIDYPDSFGVLNIRIPLGKDITFGGESCVLKNTAVELLSPLYFSPNNSQICLKGDLVLNQNTLTFEADFPLDADLITASVAYASQEIPFTGSEPIPGLQLPALSPDNELKLDLQFSKSEKRLKKVSFSMDPDIEWKLIPEILTLQQLSLFFSIYDPLADTKMIVVSIGAQACLGGNGAKLQFGGYYPPGQFYCQLDPTTPLEITAFIRHMLGLSGDQSLGGIPEFAIDELHIEYIMNGYLLAQVAVSSSWEIPLFDTVSLQLRNLRFKIQGITPYYNCQVSAGFAVEEVAFQINAAYSKNEWAFSGQSLPDSHISLNTMVSYFLKDALPDGFPKFELSNLNFTVNATTKAFGFGGTVSITAADSGSIESGLFKETDLTFSIQSAPQEQKVVYSGSLDGSLSIKGSKFTLEYAFGSDNGNSIIEASWTAQNGETLGTGDLIGALVPDSVTIPSELNLELMQVTITYNMSKKILALNVKSDNNFEGILFYGPTSDNGAASGMIVIIQTGGFSIKGLPLVGPELAKHLSFEGLTLSLLSADFSNISTLSTQYPGIGNICSLQQQQESETVNKGLYVQGTVNILGQPEEFLLPIGGESPVGQRQILADTREAEAPPDELLAPQAPQPGYWLPVEKSLGPITLQKIGLSYQDSRLYLLLDASLTSAALKIGLSGLGMGLSPTSPIIHSPTFTLHGLAVGFESTSVAISGGLLRTGQDKFLGTLNVKAKQLMISALGAYEKIDGATSLFAFAVIDYPLGGPSVFFVTGGALGFGYNRDLQLPDIDTVHTFPLIQAAFGQGGFKKGELQENLALMSNVMPPASGKYWLALGVRFTSFKVIEGFALLTVSFGVRFELALLGLANLKLPQSSAKPSAYVELALKARFAPDEGVLSVEAALTANSYILDKRCRLTGGFAFYCWFSGPHKGDFVVTLGGYHPQFKPPAHYPVPRKVGLNWEISDHLVVKGEGYFALVPSCIMAGLRVEATYAKGVVRACFTLHTDFLISWAPFFYQIGTSVTFYASVTIKKWGIRKTLSASVSASLQIWGPEFSGQATIKWSFISFTISFGASTKPESKKLDWSEFKQAFLPVNEGVCAINVTDGLLKEMKPGEGQPVEGAVVDPEHFALMTQSKIPAKRAVVNGTDLSGNRNTNFGVAPVGLGVNQFNATLSIEITKDNVRLDDGFDITEILENVPTALWGTQQGTTPSFENALISDTLTGYRITPKPAGEGKVISVSVEQLADEKMPVISYVEPTVDTSDSDQETATEEVIATIKESKTRQDIAALLKGIGLEIDRIDEQYAKRIKECWIEKPAVSFLGKKKTM